MNHLLLKVSFADDVQSTLPAEGVSITGAVDLVDRSLSIASRPFQII
jgi:hypothetical protein